MTAPRFRVLRVLQDVLYQPEPLSSSLGSVLGSDITVPKIEDDCRFRLALVSWFRDPM